ncbi:MAG: dihydrodipicolinate synthase family protein, partial [Bryobacteraceae bacterium]
MSGKEKYRLRGLVVSLNTPFDEHGRLDLESLERLVELHLREGAVGFLAPAQAGEVHAPALDEKLELVRVLRELTRGRAVLFASATAHQQRERLAVAEAAVKLGCDGVLVEPPQELRERELALREWFHEFASLGMPLLVIQDLDWQGWGLDVDLIARLFEEIPA